MYVPESFIYLFMSSSVGLIEYRLRSLKIFFAAYQITIFRRLSRQVGYFFKRVGNVVIKNMSGILPINKIHMIPIFYQTD